MSLSTQILQGNSNGPLEDPLALLINANNVLVSAGVHVHEVNERVNSTFEEFVSRMRQRLEELAREKAELSVHLVEARQHKREYDLVHHSSVEALSIELQTVKNQVYALQNESALARAAEANAKAAEAAAKTSEALVSAITQQSVARRVFAKYGFSHQPN